MTTFHIFGRREYAEPLVHLADVETDETPTVDSAGVGSDWLELVAIPADDVMWVVRDGALVIERKEALA